MQAITHDKKLRTYVLFKTELKMEEYLKDLGHFPQCPIKRHIFGMWNHCPHPYKIGKVSTKLECPSFDA